MAVTENTINETLVSGTSEADSIKNSGHSVTIDAGAGNDSVDNYGNSVTADGGVGNDILINGRYWESERGGHSITLSGGEGNDTVISHGSNSFLDGGVGDDSIINGYRWYEPWNYLYDPDDENYRGNNSTIFGGVGNDSIQNCGNNVLISAGEGNNSVYSSGDSVTIDADAGNDSISNEGSSTSISADAGNDQIENIGGQKVTIEGGVGDDTIRNSVKTRYNFEKQEWEFVSSPNNVKINSGIGNDYIINDKSWNSETQTYESGSEVVIDAGEGNDTIENSSKNITINGGAGNDSIYNDWNGENVSIFGGAGDDTISNNSSNVTINSGAGNNYIYSRGDNVFVKIDGGNNTIEGNVTISTGTGNDTLTGDRHIQIYQYKGGNDVIKNYSGEDIIEIASGKLDNYSFDGGDLIFHIGDGSLRLKNMTNHAITVKDSSGNTTTKIYSNGYSPQQVIKNFVNSLINTPMHGDIILDEAIKACSSFNSLQELIDKMVADCAKANDAQTFLRDYCGIFNDNEDGGSITGWDNGGLKMKLPENIMSATENLVYPKENTFTIRGLTVTIPEKNTLNEQEKLIVKIIYSWCLEASLELIKETYGFDFTENPCSIFLSFSHTERPLGAAWASNDWRITIWTPAFNFDESNRTALNGMLPHELTHICQYHWMITRLPGYINDVLKTQIPSYMIEGMANIVSGGDPEITEIAVNSTLLAEHLASGDYSDDWKYVLGTMFFRYLMKQASDSYDSLKSYAWKDGSSIVGTSAAELLTGSGKNQTISAGAGNDTITAYGEEMEIFGEDGDDYILAGENAKNLTLSAGAGNDSIKNLSSNVTIEGNAGNDYLSGSAGNDVMTGGKGNDTFVYSGGNDVITDYAAGDKISASSNHENYSVNGNNLIFNFGDNNSLTIQNGASKLINMNSNSNYYTADGVLDKRKKSIQLLATTEKFTADSKVMTIDGSATDAIEIIGNKKKNYIVAGENGSTLSGGKGKDTLVGGVGADLFVYNSGDGKEIIEGFSAGDSISLDSNVTIKDAKTKGGDTVLKFKGGGLTVKDTTEFKLGDTLYSGGIFVAGDSAKVYGSYKDTIDLSTYSVKDFDGSQGKKKLTITGDDSTNSLIGGKGKDYLSGGAGADTLWGGRGNDTLTGGEGNDTFIYQAGQGKDVITDYAAGDMLQILNKKGDAGDFRKATFKDDTLTLGIKGGGKILLSGVSSDTSININGENKTVSNLIK